MSATFGIPGPGGSLGQCALCGGNFLKEVLLGSNAITFHLPGVSTQLAAHEKCVNQFESKDWTELPEKSPLKIAILKSQKPK